MKGPGRVAGAVLVIGCAAPEPPSVPIVEEPRHRLVSDLDFAQVMDVQILGNDTTLFHRHAHPIAYACVSGSEMATQAMGQEWSGPGTPCPPGIVFSNPEYDESPLTHRVANMGTDIFHLVAIQNLREASDRTTLGPVTAGEQILDNDWFRALAFDLAPGRPGTGHTHDVPTLLVLTNGFGVASMSGSRETILVEPGAWTWQQPGPHSLALEDSPSARVVEIEVR